MNERYLILLLLLLYLKTTRYISNLISHFNHHIYIRSKNENYKAHNNNNNIYYKNYYNFSAFVCPNLIFNSTTTMIYSILYIIHIKCLASGAYTLYIDLFLIFISMRLDWIFKNVHNNKYLYIYTPHYNILFLFLQYNFNEYMRES